MAPKADKVRVIARPPPRAPRTGWHVLGRRSTIQGGSVEPAVSRVVTLR